MLIRDIKKALNIGQPFSYTKKYFDTANVRIIFEMCKGKEEKIITLQKTYRHGQERDCIDQ
jgi:hypothetical protein